MKGLPCAPEHWTEFSALLDEALSLPPDTRARWLEGLPAERAHLRASLADVLRADALARTDDYLAKPRLAPSPESDDAFAHGQRIGPYRLEDVLGHGGMGEVWSARRVDGTLDRIVALKLPRAEFMSAGLRSRLARERDILASLIHPHIAQLYDAGVTAQGQPYLALERVEGQPIDRHCAARRLDLDARITLFLQVLDAVGFAHRHLVVHRDLKPSNIFVTQDAQVKLLDFGIAKLLDEPGGAAGETELTRLSGRAMTPEYAAPEQLAGETVSVATDVYTLGVVLFELLCGQRPFGRERPEETPLLSTRAVADHAIVCGLASPRALRRALEGDLDAILACCLERSPERRYGSAEQLADDLRHYLHDEPIRARHISRTERAWKFVRRHRGSTALAAALVMALVVGVAGVVWQARRADAAARDAQAHARTAEDEARKANAAKNFLLDIFKGGDPRFAGDKPAKDRTARELLDAAVAHVDTDFADTPDLEIEILKLSSDIYQQLDDEPAFQALQARTLERARAVYGPANPVTLNILISEASWALRREDAQRAAALLDEADVLLRTSGQDHTILRGRWYRLKAWLAYIGSGNQEEMGEMAHRAVSLLEEVEPIGETITDALSAAALYHADRDEYEQARDLEKRALAIYDQMPERNDLGVGILLENYSVHLKFLGDFAGADAALVRSVELARKTGGETNPNYWTALARRATLLHRHGDRAAALELFESLLRTIPDHWTTDSDDAAAKADYAGCLTAEGRALAAIPILEWAMNRFGDKAVGNRARVTAVSLADAYELVGRTDDARQVLSATREIFLRQESPGSRAVALIEARWAGFLLDHPRRGAADREEAEALLRKVLTLQGGLTSIAPTLAHAGLATAALQRDDSQGALSESAAALTALQQIRELYDVRLGPRVWLVRSQALLRAGDPAGALAWASKALDASLRYDDPSSPHIAAARDAVAAAGRP